MLRALQSSWMVLGGVEDLLQAVSSWNKYGEFLKHFCCSALQKETHLLTPGPHWNLNQSMA